MCPLCQCADITSQLRTGDGRDAYVCAQCALIYVDARHHVDATEEKALYGTHHNSIDDAGYVGFLNQLLQPMLSLLAPGMRGLDFGCGPGPTLSRMAEQHGLLCDDYDPYFFPQEPQGPYDFVFATECFEHFRTPAQDIARIHGYLKPGGLLGIMTERWHEERPFTQWHYTRDKTHVVFYHARTIEMLCAQFGFSCEWMDEKRVAILRRQ